MIPRPPRSTLFPYTALFRSSAFCAPLISPYPTHAAVGNVPSGPRRHLYTAVVCVRINSTRVLREIDVIPGDTAFYHATLGDRYAIFGFSGWIRKRCEAFRVKDFDDPWDDLVIGRVCGIEPKDYTRMGAPIRHLAQKLKQVEARTKLLVTLSDGKPDDYDLEYRGEYGIEDTRQALLEARRDGIHAYCITIDREGQDDLPHRYGAANYTVVDDVAALPIKISEIYRKLTT